MSRWGVTPWMILMVDDEGQDERRCHRKPGSMDDVDEENRHPIRWKISTQPLKGDPYLAHHCRRNMVGSPPRGVPVVVDYR